MHKQKDSYEIEIMSLPSKRKQLQAKIKLTAIVHKVIYCDIHVYIIYLAERCLIMYLLRAI